MYTNLSTTEDLKVSPSAPPAEPLSSPSYIPPPSQSYQYYSSTMAAKNNDAGNMNPSTYSTANNTNNDDNDNHNKVCRICLEEDSPHTMIAPCQCKGSSKWVHRDCLDEWRTTQPDRAFSKCTECQFQYYFETVYHDDNDNDDDDDDQECSNGCCGVPYCCKDHHQRRRWLFYAYVSRDVCFGTIVLQLIIVLIATFIWAVDVNQMIPQSWPVVAQHPWSMYYLLGWFGLLVLVGLYGSIVLCCNGCSLQNSIPQFGPPPAQPTDPTTTGQSSISTTAPTSQHLQRNLYNDRGMPSSLATTSEPSVAAGTSSSYDSATVEYYRRARRYRHRRYYDYHHGRRRRHRTCCGDCTDCCFYGCYDCHPIYIYSGGGGHSDGCCCCCCCDGPSSSGGGASDCCDSGTTCCCNLHGGGSSSSSGGGGGDDGVHILLLILLVVAVILAVIGFFVGIVITVIAFQRIVSRHIHLLHKRQLVAAFQVMDLSKYNMEDLPAPSAPFQYDVEELAPPIHHPVPSAPPSEKDVSYLKQMGLMDE